MTKAASAVFLLLLAAATRLPGFGFSVLDWDESLYFLMAEQWRAGHLPYTVMWDNKPVGIYAILAGFQAVFGDSIASMRLAGLAATATTACLIALLVLRLGGVAVHGGWALLAGGLFLLASVPDDGLASNAEPFMVAFVCAGVLTLFGRAAAEPVGPLRAVVAGLCFGVACMIKYVAVFDASAVVVVLAALRWRTGGGWRPALCNAATLGGGMAMPFLAALCLFWWHGQARVFVDASLLSYLKRGEVPFSLSRLIDAFAAQARLCPPLAAAALGLAAIRGPARPLLLAWAMAGALGASVGGFFYSHYFLEVLPALCVAAGLVGTAAARRLPAPPRLAGLAVAALLLASPLVATWRIEAALGATWWEGGTGLLRDTPARIARDLRPWLTHAAGETVYVFDAQPILYSLLGVAPPTRFVLPSFLISRFMARVAGVDPATELAAIMARHPAFVIRSLRPPSLSEQAVDLDLYRQLDRTLAGHYRLWRTYDDSAVYRIDPA